MKILVFSSVEKGNYAHTWYTKKINEKLNIDICLVNFREDGYVPDFPTKLYLNSKGTKFHNFIKILLNMPNVLEEYDYFWIPDDDISYTPKNIFSLACVMRELKIELAQPAVTEDSPTWWIHHIKKNNDVFLLYTDQIELQAPMFSKSLLKKAFYTFFNGYLFWGVENVWQRILEDDMKKIAVIHHFPMIHTRNYGNIIKDAIHSKMRDTEIGWRSEFYKTSMKKRHNVSTIPLKYNKEINSLLNKIEKEYNEKITNS